MQTSKSCGKERRTEACSEPTLTPRSRQRDLHRNPAQEGVSAGLRQGKHSVDTAFLLPLCSLLPGCSHAVAGTTFPREEEEVTQNSLERGRHLGRKESKDGKDGSPVGNNVTLKSHGAIVRICSF